MSSSGGIRLTASQLVDKVPVIKSPSFLVSKPLELPPDIHPLPEDITAYFVYPHSLESHTIAVLPPILDHTQSIHQSRLKVLAAHATRKENERKAALNKLAPGWADSHGEVMEPIKRDRGSAFIPGQSQQAANTLADAPPTGSGVAACNLLEDPHQLNPTNDGMDLFERSQMQTLVRGVEKLGGR